MKRADASLVSIRTWNEFIGNTSRYSYIPAKGDIAGSLWGKSGSDDDMNSMSEFHDAGGRLKPVADILRMWSAIGIRSDKRIVFYCGTGWRASTHNLLLRLGASLFLEIIWPDPEAAPPGRPRWFGLDNIPTGAVPGLATWVVRTDDIESAVSASSESLGNFELMTRGDIEWRISIPADGAIPMGGAVPALIEWHTAVHPAASLEDYGLSLAGLEIFHPEPAHLALASVDRLQRPRFRISAW